MTQASCGALAMGSAVAALFFLRFWAASGDRLFAFFGAAFVLLAVHWLGLGVVDPDLAGRHELYVVRLAAFLVLGVGVLDKNGRVLVTGRRSAG